MIRMNELNAKQTNTQMSQNVKQPAFRLDYRVAALSLILLACGCVGPWANTSIPLPAEGSLPHQLDPTLGQEKPLPHTVAPDEGESPTTVSQRGISDAMKRLGLTIAVALVRTLCVIISLGSILVVLSSFDCVE